VSIFNSSSFGDRRVSMHGNSAKALALLLPGALAATIVWLLGSTNPFTPAGYVGYVTRGAVFGRGVRSTDAARMSLIFKGCLRGTWQESTYASQTRPGPKRD